MRVYVALRMQRRMMNYMISALIRKRKGRWMND
jgi:hypothetical protein